jgi:hypothetical protein
VADFRQRHAGLEHAVVNLQVLEHLFDERDLVGRVVNHEIARQPDCRSLAPEEPCAQGMERRDPRAGERGAGEGFDAGAHLFGGLVRKRDREDLVVLGVAFREQVRNALGDDACFARPRAGENQQRALDVQDGVALFRIETLKWIHLGSGLLALGLGKA